MNKKIERINELKREKNGVILAHYYTEPEVQEVADYIGDSYFLSEKARELKAVSYTHLTLPTTSRV